MTKYNPLKVFSIDAFNVDLVYKTNNGDIMSREYGLTPNGNELHGRWVIRDSTGKFIDHDQYRTDLVDRNGFSFAEDNVQPSTES